MKLVPNLVNTKPGGYQGNEAEHVRLALAKQIHEDSALMSTSWGNFKSWVRTGKIWVMTQYKIL